MYLNITVETPAVGNGISYKPIKGTKYVYYEHGRRYDPKELLNNNLGYFVVRNYPIIPISMKAVSY